ncbi:MAG: hypothetical protein ACAH80_02895 [Alphaproteobacteria bacterium]
MSKSQKSLKKIYNNGVASAGALGIAASIGLAGGAGALGLVGAAMGAAGASVAAMSFGPRRNPQAAVIEALGAPEEFEISVETAAPIKVMRPIRLRS